MDTTQSVVEKSAMKKVAIRLVPFVALMFFINYLDRTAISFAGPNGMNNDLALSAAQFGGISIPLALFAGSPAATIAVITITAMSIFAALPNFWTVPTQFLTGAAAAAGIALINTVGNLAGFCAGYITGWLKDLTGGYTVPMFVVGGFMLLSSILMVTLSRQRKASDGIPAALDLHGAGQHAEP